MNQCSYGKETSQGKLEITFSKNKHTLLTLNQGLLDINGPQDVELLSENLAQE